MTELVCDPQRLKYLSSGPLPKQLANLCSRLKTSPLLNCPLLNCQVPYSIVFPATRRTRILQAHFLGVNRKSTHEKSGIILAHTIIIKWAKNKGLGKKNF